MTSSESRSAQPRPQERRRNRRLHITPLVYLKVLPNNGGLLLDLSESGMCVSLAKPLTISEKVRFSFSVVEPRMIEGVGRICWVSKSGRKAGVQFVECSYIPIQQITAWLGDEGMSRQEIATQPSLQEQFANLDARESALDQPQGKHTSISGVSKPEDSLRFPDTPLFFLPQKREEHEEVIPDFSSESSRSDSSEKDGANTGCDGSVFRSAIASGSAEEEENPRKKSGLGRAVARMALLVVLAALCFAAYRYEGPLLGLEAFVPQANKVINPTPAKRAKPRHIISRSSYPLRKSGEIARVYRSGNVYSFHAPGITGGSFSIQGVFPGLQGPSIRASGVAPSSPEPENAVPGGSVKSFSGVTFIGLMATLRNDGALVEEGGFTPPPPKRSDPTSVLEQIVLDVAVGRNGEVKGVRIVSSPDSKLADAVIRSVKKWIYRPLYERGRAVEFTTRITLNFSKVSQ